MISKEEEGETAHCVKVTKFKESIEGWQFTIPGIKRGANTSYTVLDYSIILRLRYIPGEPSLCVTSFGVKSLIQERIKLFFSQARKIARR